MAAELQTVTPEQATAILRAAGVVVRNGQGPDELMVDNPHQLIPFDWEGLQRAGLPQVEYLEEPYFTRGARTWLWGPTGAAKSMFALWLAARLSRRRDRVSYFSEENPLAEDVRRLGLLRPDWSCFRFFHRQGLDLTDPGWVRSVLETTTGDQVVVFDTWTDCWSGDEGDNAAVRDFDTQVMKPLQAQGVTPVVVHHSGHPQAFVKRKGASAARGASSLGQKADVILEFKAGEDREFTIVHAKARLGGGLDPDRSYRVVDADDGLDIIEVESPHAAKVRELADHMVEAIENAPAGYLTTTELRLAVGGRKAGQEQAMDLLAGEDPPRVRARMETVDRDGQRRDVKAWRPV